MKSVQNQMILSTVFIVIFLAGLFTLVLASIFPSSAADKFTVSKLLAVLLR